MALTRQQKFIAKKRILEIVNHRQTGYSYEDKNLLLAEFGLQTLDRYDDYTFGDALSNVSDDVILELLEITTGDSPNITIGATTTPIVDETMWKANKVKLFISHSAVHKKYCAEISEELDRYGVQGFVAHESMTVEKSWQTQIESALRSMDAFVVINHPEVNTSNYCQQEIGWALARNVPINIIRIGADPTGFPASIQWPAGEPDNAITVASNIIEWIKSKHIFNNMIVDPLFDELDNAGSFHDAKTIMAQIKNRKDISAENLDRIAASYLNNFQVRQSIGAYRDIKEIFEKFNRPFPPQP